MVVNKLIRQVGKSSKRKLTKSTQASRNAANTVCNTLRLVVPSICRLPGWDPAAGKHLREPVTKDSLMPVVIETLRDCELEIVLCNGMRITTDLEVIKK